MSYIYNDIITVKHLNMFNTCFQYFIVKATRFYNFLFYTTILAIIFFLYLSSKDSPAFLTLISTCISLLNLFLCP